MPTSEQRTEGRNLTVNYDEQADKEFLDMGLSLSTRNRSKGVKRQGRYHRGISNGKHSEGLRRLKD